MKNYPFLNKVTTDYINSLINIENFSEDLFDRWVYENNIEYKSNPNSYIQKCFKKELDNGTFKPKVQVLTMIPMFNEMRARRIKIYQVDTEYISQMESHLVFTGQVTREELKDLNNKAIEYIVTHKEKPSTKDFIEVFVRSKRKLQLPERK